MEDFYQEAKIFTGRGLEEIFEAMYFGRELWFNRSVDKFQVPITGVGLNKTSFLLMSCLTLVRGEMAAGNWLQLPMEFYYVPGAQERTYYFSAFAGNRMIGYEDGGKVVTYDDHIYALDKR